MLHIRVRLMWWQFVENVGRRIMEIGAARREREEARPLEQLTEQLWTAPRLKIK